MKRALIFALALVVLAPAVQAAENGWPDEYRDIQKMVRASVGDVSYDRVKVRRSGKVVDVSIKLKNTPRQFRSFAEKRAGDDDVFLATNLVELFEPSLEFDTVSYDLLPVADILTYYFGFGVFNFDKKIKRKAEIRVIGGNGMEFENVKKKYKLNKRSIQLRFLERNVSGDGLYALETIVGPWQLVTYFCNGC